MNNHFDSLEAVGEEFKKADDIETESLFIKGHVVRKAVEQGFDTDLTIGYCASLTHLDKRTVYRYYSTARTFPKRMFDLRHELHAIAADTIDYRKEMTADELTKAQENALEWLKIASKESLSTRALRAAIKAAGGRVDVKPEVLLDGVEAIFDTIEHPIEGLDFTSMIVHIPCEHYERLSKLGHTTQVKVTLVLVSPTEAKQEA